MSFRSRMRRLPVLVEPSQLFPVLKTRFLYFVARDNSFPALTEPHTEASHILIFCTHFLEISNISSKNMVVKIYMVQIELGFIC